MPLFVGLLCGVAGLVLAGWIASLCAEWFHASNFEGASGYMVVTAALLGGAAAFGIGVVCGWRAGAFGRGLAYGLGIVGGLSLLAWGFARLTGDVPPTWSGSKLMVAAELKTPAGWLPSNAIRFRGVTMQLLRVENGTGSQGHTTWAEAVEQNGRWVIPGHAELFTRKGSRRLRFLSEKETLAEFDLPLPANPGPQFARWSEWQPGSGFQFRFCVRKAEDVRAVENQRFEQIESRWKQKVASMKPDAPLSEWTPLLYTDDQRKPDTDVLVGVLETIRARPMELAPLVVSKEDRMARCALRGVGQLYSFPEGLVQPLRTAAENLAQDLRSYAAGYDARDPDLGRAVELKLRFAEWIQAWQKSGRPAPPELESIRKAAADVPEGTEIDGLKTMAGGFLRN